MGTVIFEAQQQPVKLLTNLEQKDFSDNINRSFYLPLPETGKGVCIQNEAGQQRLILKFVISLGFTVFSCVSFAACKFLLDTVRLRFNYMVRIKSIFRRFI